jgi:hypothetical protein
LQHRQDPGAIAAGAAYLDRDVPAGAARTAGSAVPAPAAVAAVAAVLAGRRRALAAVPVEAPKRKNGTQDSDVEFHA